jgi:hypothetical protein
MLLFSIKVKNESDKYEDITLGLNNEFVEISKLVDHIRAEVKNGTLSKYIMTATKKTSEYKCSKHPIYFNVPPYGYFYCDFHENGFDTITVHNVDPHGELIFELYSK